MAESILTGQGNYGPLHLPWLRGPMRLWKYRQSTPAAQNTVIVYTDGSVLEGNNFDYATTTASDVHRVFVGGYRNHCDALSDPLSYNALIDAGYTFYDPTTL